MGTVEIIVAKFQESLDWLPVLLNTAPPPAGLTVTIYDKGGLTEESVEEWNALADDLSIAIEVNVVPLQNVGREAHSYLRHLCERYDRLPDVTLFLQGNPLDHSCLGEIAAGLAWAFSLPPEVAAFAPLGRSYATDGPDGAPNHPGLPVGQFYTYLFDKPSPPSFTFRMGAQFLVTREAVRRRSSLFYLRALGLIHEIPSAPWVYERLWSAIFEDGA